MRSLSFIKKFLPVFAIALILPFILMLSSSSVRTSLTSQASNEKEIRVWLEPANVITSAGKSIQMKVIALYDSETKVVPYMSVDLSHLTDFKISPTFIETTKPFSGKIVVGTFTLTAKSSGSYKLDLPKNVINTRLPSEVEVITTGASISVK